MVDYVTIKENPSILKNMIWLSNDDYINIIKTLIINSCDNEKIIKYICENRYRVNPNQFKFSLEEEIGVDILMELIKKNPEFFLKELEIVNSRKTISDELFNEINNLYNKKCLIKEYKKC